MSAGAAASIQARLLALAKARGEARFRRKMPASPALEEAARRTLDALPKAMTALAQLGLGST